MIQFLQRISLEDLGTLIRYRESAFIDHEFLKEFDHEFIEELGRFIIQFVASEGMASVSDISSRVRISGISKVFPDSHC